jgi:transposase
LTGRFDDHHAELARMLLDQIDALATQIGTLTSRIDELLTTIEPETRADEPDTPGRAGTIADGACESTTIERLDEIPGIGPGAAQIILAESARTPQNRACHSSRHTAQASREGVDQPALEPLGLQKVVHALPLGAGRFHHHPLHLPVP